MDISDNCMIMYKINLLELCFEECSISNVVKFDFLDFYSFFWEYMYFNDIVYKFFFIGCNVVFIVIKIEWVVVVVKFCSNFNVMMYLLLVGNIFFDVIVYYKRKLFMIKNDIKVDCEVIKEICFVWRVCRYFSYNKSCV